VGSKTRWFSVFLNRIAFLEWKPAQHLTHAMLVSAVEMDFEPTATFSILIGLSTYCTQANILCLYGTICTNDPGCHTIDYSFLLLERLMCKFSAVKDLQDSMNVSYP
jgi:hypothetical protein